jgi:hypothetical protein
MSISQMREALKAAYKSKKWADRVNQMPDGQVYAIFRNLQSQGKV